MAMKTVKVKDCKPKDKCIENCFEWISGTKSATLTISEPTMIKRVKKIYEERTDEFKAYTENADGSICVTVPRRWLKINPGSKSDGAKREMTEEQKQVLRDRLAAGRAKKKSEREE